MNNKKIILLLVTALALPIYLAAKPSPGSKKGGTSIFHLFVRKTMQSIGSNASGELQLMQVKQGNANNQSLKISVANLEATTSYQLLARLGDDTNFTHITDFVADSGGNALLRLRSLGNGNGKGNGKTPLPALLNPVSNIRELAIADTNAVVLLAADLTNPTKLQYLVKRAMTNDGVEAGATADLRIKATTASTQFRLLSQGLTPNANYSLAVNDGIAQTVAADANGDADFDTLLVNPNDILAVRSLRILNGTSNSIFSTQLP